MLSNLRLVAEMNDDTSDKKLQNEQFWREQLQHPDWYIKLENYLKEKIFPVTSDKSIKRQRQLFYETVEAMLVEGKIPLADEGPNFDADRNPIDTILIHHTSEDPDIRLSKLSAIGLVRQYGKDYLKNDVLGYNVKGSPIWSNHFKDGKMVFFAYHWLVRPDGKTERLLEDKYIGWQSGNWDINTRSVAIALSGDYSDEHPSKEQLEGIGNIIKDNYSRVSSTRILGHREVNPKTICPGNKFLSEQGWKDQII